MRIALIGFGKWGRNYFSTINQSGMARISHILVRNPERLLAENLFNSVIITSDVEQIECDAVIVATHPSATVSFAEYFIKKNIPVMLEKPAGLSMLDAIKIQNALVEHPVPILVSHQHLFSVVYQEIKARINSEEVMQIETVAGNLGPYRDYSFIWDYAPHDLAMILGLKQNKPIIKNSIIESSGPFIGRCRISMMFADKSGSHIDLWNNQLPKTRLLKVQVKEKRYVYDDINSPSSLFINAEKIEIEYTSPLSNAVSSFLMAVDSGRTTDYRFGSHWVTSIAEIIEKIISCKSTL